MEYIFNACIDYVRPDYRPMMQRARDNASYAFETALISINSILEPQAVEDMARPNSTFELSSEAILFIPSLICKIYKENEFERAKNALNLNFTGDRLLTYLAILHDPRCLRKNGSIDLKYTQIIARAILKYIEEKREVGDSNFSEEAAQRVRVFLERMVESNRQLLCAIQNIKLEWLAQDKCRLIFGEIEAFSYQVCEQAGQILFDFKSQALPRGKDIERIIILVPGVSDLIYRLGAAEKLVGVVKKDKQWHSDQVMQVCRGKDINFDLINQLKPDLILASPHQVKELFPRLTGQFGVEIYTVSPNQDTADLIFQLGKWLDVSKKITSELALGYGQGVSAVSFRLV